MTLAEDNAALLKKAGAMFSDDVKKVYGASQQIIDALEIPDKAFGVGDTVPLFELPDSNGQLVSIADILASGPAVISFYRGAWCPFCNLELRAMQKELESANADGVTLVAISPNTPDTSLEFVNEIEVTFPVLSDVDNVIAKQFNLVFELDDGLVELMKSQGRDLTQMNGSDKWELPVPATYVVDTDGVIRYAYVDSNHRTRAEPSEVIAIAKSL